MEVAAGQGWAQAAQAMRMGLASHSSPHWRTGAEPHPASHREPRATEAGQDPTGLAGVDEEPLRAHPTCLPPPSTSY